MPIEDIQEIKNTIKKLNKVITSLPEGELSIGHHNGSSKWFHYKDHKQVYIKKDNRLLAKKLAIKKYLSLKVELLEAQLKEASYKKRHTYAVEQKLETILKDSAYLELLNEYLSSTTLEYRQWMNADYPKNTNHPETLVHPTVGGLLVRSKSESMIAVALSENNIPYRYENLLELNGITLAPDFTILHPVSGRIYYWEHFGLLDNDQYCSNLVQKIRTYAEANIILGENLIITYETQASPLNFHTINNIIKQYF
ncbi:MAG: hypothetical protein K5883_04910 [Pseudobutyrivibrio sp.]|nr:hypothetical protein [Pseudobutyrivibrio sp.]